MNGTRFLALGAALVFGMGSTVELRAQGSAAPQAGAERGAKARGERGEKARGERGEKARGARGEKARGARGEKARGARGAQNRAMGGLFRDIALSKAQKTQVKAVHDRYRPQMQALRPQGQRARGDSAARPDSAKMAQARTLMASQRADIRAILTPAQQTTFDRNVAQMQERGERRWGEAGARKGGKAKGARRGKTSGR